MDSPVEALAGLNYLSYGFLTSVNRMLAAWLAAVTAAFSFWRMGPSSPPRPGRCRDAAAPPQEELAAELVSTNGRETNNYCAISALETENSTKGKFVLYYGNDDFREGGVVEAVDDEEEEEEEEDGVSAESEKFRPWSDDVDWERKMEIRMAAGNMGWYRCQDLAAFNGSVVRFWDGCSRRPVCATA